MNETTFVIAWLWLAIGFAIVAGGVIEVLERWWRR